MTPEQTQNVCEIYQQRIDLYFTHDGAVQAAFDLSGLPRVEVEKAVNDYINAKKAPAEPAHSEQSAPAANIQQIPEAPDELPDFLTKDSVPAAKLDPFDALGYVGRLFESGDWIDLKFIHQTETWTDEHGAKHAKIYDNFMTLADALQPETLKRIHEAQDQGWNVYVGMNAFTPGLHRRRKQDVKNIRNVYVEFDENGPEGLAKIDADVAVGLVHEPQFIIESSPLKFYVIWLVTGFTVEQQEALNTARTRHR
jgi:hypothetical protein